MTHTVYNDTFNYNNIEMSKPFLVYSVWFIPFFSLKFSILGFNGVKFVENFIHSEFCRKNVGGAKIGQG